jgi:hypothetical protein
VDNCSLAPSRKNWKWYLEPKKYKSHCKLFFISMLILLTRIYWYRKTYLSFSDYPTILTAILHIKGLVLKIAMNTW